MRTADTARLLALAVIWSASFVCHSGPRAGARTRVGRDVARVLVAGIALTAGFVILREHVDAARHWRAYLFVGVLNSALPFLLFAFAALTLPASYLVILNTALPLFGAVASAIWLSGARSRQARRALSRALPACLFVSRAGPVVPDAAFADRRRRESRRRLVLRARRRLDQAPRQRRCRRLRWPAGASFSGGLALLPVAAMSPVHGPITATIVINVLLLALLGSAVATTCSISG